MHKPVAPGCPEGAGKVVVGCSGRTLGQGEAKLGGGGEELGSTGIYQNPSFPAWICTQKSQICTSKELVEVLGKSFEADGLWRGFSVPTSAIAYSVYPVRDCMLWAPGK